MSDPKLEIHLSAFDPQLVVHCWTIRDQVFSQEQQIDPSLDLDGLDEQAWHALATLDGEPVGTGRMLSDGHIGRLAVLKEFRGMGIGRALMSALGELAQTQGYPRLFLSSQQQAVPFYETLGYQACAKPHIEAGIPHQMMEKHV